MLGGRGITRVVNVERRKLFREYLLVHYRSNKTGRPLSLRASSDVCCRCHRVESVMGVDLDEALREVGLDELLRSIKEAEGKFSIKNNAAASIVGLRSAVRVYAMFLKTELS